MKLQYEDVFRLFDGYLVAHPSDNYLSKPTPRYFYKFIQQFGRGKLHIVFVDDSLKNIDTANHLQYDYNINSTDDEEDSHTNNKNNKDDKNDIIENNTRFQGYLFKNAKMLREELQRRNIL